MATMGKRGITRNKPSPEAAELSSSCLMLMGINLVIIPAQVQPAATLGLAPSVPGVPIMREGFITGTGLLLGSPTPFWTRTT
jgi:hypothetical protein